MLKIKSRHWAFALGSFVCLSIASCDQSNDVQTEIAQSDENEGFESADDAETPPQTIQIPTIKDDVRYTTELCRASGQLNEAGECNSGAVANEVIGGSSPANRNQFISTAGILSEDLNSNGQVVSTICSGTLVAPTIVLTARHCAEPSYGYNWEIKSVVIGLDVDPAKDPAQVVIAVRDCADFGSSTFSKCQFSGPNSRPSERDVLIVRLATPATITPTDLADPAQVLSAGVLTAVGFGLTGNTLPDGSPELGNKQYAEVPVVSSSCNGAKGSTPDFQYYGCTPDIELVAGRGEHQSAPSKDTCGGDSGGPLLLARVDQLSGAGRFFPFSYYLSRNTWCWTKPTSPALR